MIPIECAYALGVILGYLAGWFARKWSTPKEDPIGPVYNVPEGATLNIPEGSEIGTLNVLGGNVNTCPKVPDWYTSPYTFQYTPTIHDDWSKPTVTW